MTLRRSRTLPVDSAARSKGKLSASFPLGRAASALLLVLGALFLAACGSATRSSSMPTEPAAATRATSAPSSDGSASDGIARFGAPASAREHGAVAALLRKYVDAAVGGEASTACGLLSRPLRDQVSAGGAGGSPARACDEAVEATVRALFSTTDGRTVLPAVQSVRIKGAGGFVIFRLASGPWQFFPLVREARGWRLGAIGPTLF